MERPFLKPEARLLGASNRDFKSLCAPDAQDPLAVQLPARAFQACGDALVAVAGVLEGKHPDLGGEVVLFRIGFGDVALGAARLAQHPAGSSFGDLEDRPDVVDALRRRCGLRSFLRPLIERIWLSSVRSATACFKRLFSSRRRLFSLGLGNRHPTVAGAPAVIGLDVDRRLAAALLDGAALGDAQLDGPELVK